MKEIPVNNMKKYKESSTYQADKPSSDHIDCQTFFTSEKIPTSLDFFCISFSASFRTINVNFNNISNWRCESV